MTNYDEIGKSGLKEFSGYVQEAYNRELTWPSVQPLYSRLRRSDPEIAAVRQVFTALARSVAFHWELPDDANDADKAAAEFGETVLDDLEGGMSDFTETMVSQVPFFGWGWWEVLPGYRDPKWAPPEGDEWRSQYDDKRIGIRRLAWRDTSSFYRWDMDDKGRVMAMIQYAIPDPPVSIPASNSLHLKYGDAHNPEGLSPLEAVWRLERIKYGLEVVQGIGFEHAAGYLDITANDKLSDEDKVVIKRIAKAILSAQEGNYAAWPKGVTGEIKDVPFSAAPSILDAIKYFGILKLQIFNMQWMALSATSGSGSFAAMNDSSSMFVMTYNAMIEGFARQMDAQIGKRLFRWNNFPGITKRPHLKADTINKLSLSELASILAPLKSAMNFGPEDIKAIRKQTGFMPETLPEGDEAPAQSVDVAPATDATTTDAPMPDETTAEAMSEMALELRLAREALENAA